MIYSGQELPNKKRLKFFEKDSIEWDGKFELHDFYKTLLTLHASSKCLRAGDLDVLTKIVSHPDDHQVFSYARTNGDDQVLIVLNFSGGEMNFQVNGVTWSFQKCLWRKRYKFRFRRSCIFKALGISCF